VICARSLALARISSDAGMLLLRQVDQRIGRSRQVAAVIKPLVQRLRRSWPQVKTVVRGDSGFCRQRLLSWCERPAVGYVIGLARNARLQAQVSG